MSAARPGRLNPAARRALAEARRGGVRLVRFLYTDNGGVTRGKATHVASLAARITDGIGLTVAMQAMNMLDQLTAVEGMGPVGEIRLKPDPETFTPLPYAPHAAAMTVDMCTLDGAAWEACPRSFLKRQIGVPPGAAPAHRGMKPLCFLIDRFDSIVGMLLALTIAVPISWQTWGYVLVIGPMIHWSFSAALFRLHVKTRPA